METSETKSAKAVKDILPSVLKNVEASRTMPKVSRQCVHCLKEFEAETRYQDHCPVCLAEKLAEAKKGIAARRQDRWLRVCPGEYREVNFSLLPNRAAYDQALTRSGSSLLLHGISGRGKTRCAWQIVRIDILSGRSVEVLDSMAGIRFAAKFHDGAEAVERWMDEIICADTVLMDDVFKSKITEAFDAFLYAIVDQRVSNGRKIICTCNDTGKTLSERLSQDRSEPFIRRLREHCHAIAF